MIAQNMFLRMFWKLLIENLKFSEVSNWTKYLEIKSMKLFFCDDFFVQTRNANSIINLANKVLLPNQVCYHTLDTPCLEPNQW